MGKKPNILVVGSFVMDLIVSTQRLPENGETVLGTGFRTAPGGKGLNQAVQAARLGAQVVAGIGFIGAGCIIVTRRRRVKGLTTAAGLWAAAVIGLCLFSIRRKHAIHSASRSGSVGFQLGAHHRRAANSGR